MNFMNGLNLGVGITMSIAMYWNLQNKNYVMAGADFILAILNFGLVFI